MDKELYIKQLKPFLYLMDEAHEATGYIVVGDEKVCGDLQKERSVCATACGCSSRAF